MYINLKMPMVDKIYDKKHGFSSMVLKIIFD